MHCFEESMDYSKLLKKARKEMPEAVFEKERFEIPKVKGRIQGNKTFIVNFNQIVEALRRPAEHLVKFLTKELGTPASIAKNNTLIFNTKVSASMLNKKVFQYAKEYVLCFECGKPDTKIIQENNVTYLRCLACGAKYPIRSRI